MTLSSQLEEAQQKVTETQDLNEKYEQVQLEKMQLQEELDALKTLMAQKQKKPQTEILSLLLLLQVIPNPAAALAPAHPAAV